MTAAPPGPPSPGPAWAGLVLVTLAAFLAAVLALAQAALGGK